MDFPPIGLIKSAFTEKFGVPRQSLMVKDARAVIKLHPQANFREALNHLETFSHIWVIFVFDRSIQEGWTPTISPPRIDAPKRVGLFSSRSPHRPNPIGISAVKLDRIDLNAPGGIEIHISGVDLLNDTPVLDIKPYLPYADLIPEANSGWAGSEIRRYPVSFSPESLETIDAYSTEKYPQFKSMITQMLELDPRPKSQRESLPIHEAENSGRKFLFRLLDFDVEWRIENSAISVSRLIRLN